MTADIVRLRERFGPDCVQSWQPASALSDLLPAETPVVSPGDLETAQEILRFAARERLRVLPAGAMEHLYLGAPPGAVDLVLSSRKMDRILEYEPDDLTLVAQAGVTLHEIDARTREHGQRLAPDPWPGTAATLGGACAANRAGIGRLRAGTLRDHVLGARVAHADGTTSRTGGKVVKNVTGYDLAKLYVGSCGSLVFLAEVNLRLVPRPGANALVHSMHTAGAARARLLDVHRSWLQPAALVVVHGAALPPDLRLALRDSSSNRVGPQLDGLHQKGRRGDGLHHDRPHLDGPHFEGMHPDGLHLLVRFEGRPEAVRAQVQECVSALGGNELAASAAASIWEVLRRFEEPEPDEFVLELSSMPLGVVDALEAVRETCGADAGFIGLYGVGTSCVRLHRRAADRLAALAARLDGVGARWRLVYAPADMRRLLAEPMPPAPALQSALKSAYDPERRLRPAPFATKGSS